VDTAKVIRLVGQMQRDAAEVMRLLQVDAAGTRWDRRRELLDALRLRTGRSGRIHVDEWRRMATSEPYLYDARGLGGFFRGGLVERDGDQVVLTNLGAAIALGHTIDSAMAEVEARHGVAAPL
jgi:hypothetical protein